MSDPASPLPDAFTGALLGEINGAVYGWARGPGDQAAIVEILGDDEPLAIGRSGIRLPDPQGLTPMLATHGFLIALGTDTTGAIGRITARFANTTRMLDGAIFPLRTQGLPPPTPGGVFHSGGLRVVGWLMPDPLTGRAPAVVALCDGEPVAEDIAQRNDPYLRAIGAPAGACGFDLTLPFRLADGRAHQITVCSDDGEQLPGSPLTVQTLPASDLRWLDRLPLTVEDRRILLAAASQWRGQRPLSLGWDAYADWKQRFGQPDAAPPASGRAVVVVVGPHAADTAALRATLESLAAQTHRHWRALVWSDRITLPDSGSDPRIHLVPPARWRSALDAALSATGIAACLPAGDQWAPSLLSQALDALTDEIDLCYCDVDDAAGGLPWFKPDWCLDTFVAMPLLHHGFVCRTSLLDHASQDPDDWPWQAVAASAGAPRAAHLAYPMHTRGPQSRNRAPMLAGPLAAQVGLADWQASVDDGPHRVRWPDPDRWPRVCLLVPTRDQYAMLRRCIDSLRATDYPAMSICVIDNQSVDPQTLDYLDALSHEGVRVLRWPHPFNYAAMHNDAIARIDCELIALVNNDVRALDASWLRALVRNLLRPGVGATGAKLLWPNGMVQHGGVVLGLHGAAGHIGNQWLADDAGYHHCNRITRSVSAVTGACLLTRRSDYLAVGGMDAAMFPINFNDVDFCLKLRARGQRILWVADAVLEHAESLSRGADDSPARSARADRERLALSARWGETLLRDPFYNVNLNLDRYSHNGLAVPPRHHD